MFATYLSRCQETGGTIVAGVPYDMMDGMIAKISGTIEEVGLSSAIVMVGSGTDGHPSGLGYRVFLTGRALAGLTLGDPVSLFTHHVIRENAQDLYGFATKNDLEFFELLLTVNGIGPKSALAIMNTASIETLREGIASGDAGHLSKTSGLGKKSAEKIVHGLKDKIGSLEDFATGGNLSDSGMAIEALAALGYSERDARDAIARVDKTLSTEHMVKEALKNLAK